MSATEVMPIEALEPRQQQQILSVMPDGQLDIVSMGKVLAQCGYFKDIKSLSQGIVKIMLGRELGLGPLMSIMKLYIVKENPVISANLMASRIRQSGTYDYELIVLDQTKAKIRFSRKIGGAWKVLTPDIDFTIDHAKVAQVGGWNSQYNPKKGKDFDPDSNWTKWPRNMLFARAMSDGYRFHCPDVFSMSVYTPADFEVPIDASGEIMRDITPEEKGATAPVTTSAPTDGKGTSVIDRIVQEKTQSAGPKVEKIAQEPSGPEVKEESMVEVGQDKNDSPECSVADFEQIEALAKKCVVTMRSVQEHVTGTMGFESYGQLTKARLPEVLRWINAKALLPPAAPKPAAADGTARCTDKQFETLESERSAKDLDPKTLWNWVKGTFGYKTYRELQQQHFSKVLVFIQAGGKDAQ